MALTKKDLEKLSDVFATKSDLEKFATKEEMNARFDQVTKTLDWLVGKVQSILGELKINLHSIVDMMKGSKITKKESRQ